MQSRPYSAGALKILREFRANPSVLRARAISFIDDTTVILPSNFPLIWQLQGKLRNGCMNSWG